MDGLGDVGDTEGRQSHFKVFRLSSWKNTAAILGSVETGGVYLGAEGSSSFVDNVAFGYLLDLGLEETPGREGDVGNLGKPELEVETGELLT